MRFSRVAVVILHYSGLPDTLACLDSLRASRGIAYNTIVVNNATAPGVHEAIAEAAPQASIISTGANLGYAGGNNIGIRAALKGDADAVFLVNNDTLIDAEGMATLAETLRLRPRAGIVGSMVYTYDEGRVISSAGGAIDWRHGNSANVGAGEIDRGQHEARPVDFINGCGLMITREAIDLVGPLDERYFMYWEETDWCTRVKRSGFEVRFEPAARMRHKATIRSEDLGPATLYYMTRNRLLFFATYAPLRVKPVALAHAIHGAWREIVRHRQAGRAQHARAMRTGLIDGLRRRWGRVDASAWQTNPSQSPSQESMHAINPKP